MDALSDVSYSVRYILLGEARAVEYQGRSGVPLIEFEGWGDGFRRQGLVSRRARI